MKIPESFKKVILEVICLLYILLFVYASVSKMIDFENFQIQLGQSPLISAFAGLAAPSVLFLELLTALLLMVPKLRMAALFLALGMMSLFTTYIIIILNYSSFIPCSCGGILEKMSWRSHLIFNIAFVLLAMTAILLHHNIEKPYHSRKKSYLILVKMISTIICTTAIIIILFRRSESIMHFENPFIRRYPQHPAAFENQLDLKYNSYYFAGESGGRIYLGNYTAPLNIKSADQGLKSLKAERITFRTNEIPFKKPIVSVQGFYFFLKEGSVPAVYRGKTSDWKINYNLKGIPYFTQSVQIDSTTTGFRSNNGENLGNILGVFNQYSRPSIKYNGRLLQRQIDGVFDTDGILLYSEKIQRLVYVYFYRNEFIIANNSGHLVRRGNTIDTVSKAKIGVAYLKGNKERTMNAPPLIVNANAAVYDNLLFIHSRIKGKFEDNKLWEQASIIDVYDISKNIYLMSFPIYNLEDNKMRSFYITKENCFALIGNSIVVYKFRDILKKEFKNNGFVKK
ncbi:hypothetical protein NYQ10_15660 [Flavobacterium johnsoniae]|nr:MauE/DoxX family redox-associated membrane protein [Flavobacterium johnsoniae]WJS93528.1 hypothetical protein NYQ10_15660 [Flavobacterium johnsoniae]